MTTTHIYFLLDRSGSMASMAADVIGGFNGFVAAQRSDGDDARMTLVQFDSENPFEVLADATPIAQMRELTAATFQPRGGTPLLDATGRLIAHAAARAEQRRILGKKAEEILVVTFTDGEENQSRELTKRDVAKLVAAKQEAGWTFAFLGAGIDAYAEAGQVGYDPRSVQAAVPDAAGAAMAFHSLSRATSNRRMKARSGAAYDKADFFENVKEAEEDLRRRGQQ